MRIMLVLPDFLDTHSRRLTQLLLTAGQDVVAVGKQNPLPQPAPGFTYIKYPIFQLSRKWRGQFVWRFISERGAALLLRQKYRQIKPDLVHVIWIDLRAYHYALADVHPLILTSLGSDINNVYETADKNSNNWKRTAVALKNADFLTADTREVLERSNIIAEIKMKSDLVYFGIDTNLFTPRPESEKMQLRNKLGIPESAKVIISPRRLNAKMQHDVILKAFAKLVIEDHMNAVLVFRQFGFASTEYQDSLKALSVSLGINDSVIWIDEMDYEDLPVLYSLADVAVNVPEQDALPVTLFEMSACQTPVITSRLFAYSDYISQGCYTQVPVGDVQSLYLALLDVLRTDPGQMKICLEKNRHQVISTAGQENSLGKILKIYTELVNHQA